MGIPQILHACLFPCADSYTNVAVWLDNHVILWRSV